MGDSWGWTTNRSRSWASDSAASPAGAVAWRRRRTRMRRDLSAIVASQSRSGAYLIRRQKWGDASIFFSENRFTVIVEGKADNGGSRGGDAGCLIYGVNGYTGGDRARRRPGPESGMT